MPFDINLEQLPAGYAFTSARSGECVGVRYRDFTSTEDGQQFIQRVESSTYDFLQPSLINPSQVDHLLAVCRNDRSATIYVNELEHHALVRTARPVEVGPVTKDDIADVERLELGVHIPDDAGFLFLFSVNWRKGLFFDFGPILPDPQPRQYDVAALLGQAYSHVLFQERFSITDDEWNALFAEQWFPFVGLRNKTIDKLISYIRSGWKCDEILDEIVLEVKSRVPKMLESWRNHSSFLQHIDILERAVERFLDNDTISCTSLLFNRIEGILRTNHLSISTASMRKQKNLVESAVKAKIKNEKCLLLPYRFNSYLNNIYFADFKPDADAQNIAISRNSVGHGVASVSEFNLKSSVIGILIVHQLFYLLENDNTDLTKLHP